MRSFFADDGADRFRMIAYAPAVTIIIAVILIELGLDGFRSSASSWLPLIEVSAVLVKNNDEQGSVPDLQIARQRSVKLEQKALTVPNVLIGMITVSLASDRQPRRFEKAERRKIGVSNTVEELRDFGEVFAQAELLKPRK